MNKQLVYEAILGERPLVTFALFAYNQEKYIREAVEGAFAQTYSPLQIILSDDCSPDKTFEIMEKMTAQYAGPHEILLNRNKQNKGLAGHINYVMSLARGELIVIAAGDDISFPERTLKILNFFKNNNYPATIFTGLQEIASDGSIWCGKQIRQTEQKLSEFLLSPNIRGATCAYDKRIFTQFQKLNSAITAEDYALPVRAYLLNRPPKILDEKLIFYRQDIKKNRGSSNFADKLFWQIWPKYSSSIQQKNDADYVDEISPDYHRAIQLNSRNQQTGLDVIQTPTFTTLINKSWQYLRVFGARKLVKLWVIRYGHLSTREKKLIGQNFELESVSSSD